MTTLYEKRGRKYAPVADERQWDSWPIGFSIVHVSGSGGRSTRFNINPDKASYYAAIRERKAALRHEIGECFKLRPTKTPLSDKQIKAWRAFERAMGGDIYAIAQESVDGVIDRIFSVLENPHG